MNGYPCDIIEAYRIGEVSRRRFITQFSAWQKSCGINYDCKGAVDERGVHLIYRGVTATSRNGALHFVIDGKERAAETPFEFRRKVDFAIYRKLRGAAW